MRSVLLFASALVTLAACTTGPEGTGSSNDAIVESIRSMVQRPDGRFDVTCADGHAEIATADQIRANDVCGTAAPAGVTVTYTCDSSANLQISAVDASGDETTKSVSIGSFSTCSATVRSLQQTRGSIVRPSIVGVCDSSANLQRFAVSPTAGVVALPTTSIGSFSSCNTSATATNAAFPPVANAAMVDYTCNSSANLEIVAVGTSGAGSSGQVPIGSFSTCESSAKSLRQTRSDVQRTVVLGVCDSSANLERFSVTTAGGLKTLATTSIGSFSTCNTQAAALNQ